MANKQNEQTDIAEGKKDGYQLEEVRIKPAENGFVVCCEWRKKPKESGKGEPEVAPMAYGSESETYVHEDLDGALDRVRELFNKED